MGDRESRTWKKPLKCECGKELRSSDERAYGMCYDCQQDEIEAGLASHSYEDRHDDDTE